MRTTVSVPDELLARADALAARLGMSRSELYAAALSDFIAKHSPGRITERLDALYAVEDSALDPALRKAQARAVGPEEW